MTEPSSLPPPPPAAITLVVGGQATGRFPLDPTADNTLGRATQATVTIPDRLASRAHAAIRFHTVRREWVLRDLGSRNGTWLGGRRIDVAPLLPGAVVRIGASELVFECGAPESPAAPADQPPAGTNVTSPSDGHATIDLDEPVRAGDASASRLSRHGTIVLTEAPAAAPAGGPALPEPLSAESLVTKLPSLNLRDWQRTLILEALRRHAGDARAAAVDLGVDADRLHDVLARHGLITRS